MKYGDIELKEPPDQAFIIINKGQNGLAKAMEFFGGNVFLSKNKAKEALKELKELERLDEFHQKFDKNHKTDKYINCEIRRVLIFEEEN